MIGLKYGKLFYVCLKSDQTVFQVSSSLWQLFSLYSLQVFLSPRTSSRCAKRSWAASSGCLCMFTSITSTVSAAWVQRPTSILATSTTTSSSPSSTSLITLNLSPWWDVGVTSDVWAWRKGAVKRRLDGCFALSIEGCQYHAQNCQAFPKNISRPAMLCHMFAEVVSSLCQCVFPTSAQEKNIFCVYWSCTDYLITHTVGRQHMKCVLPKIIIIFHWTLGKESTIHFPPPFFHHERNLLTAL